MPAVTKTEPPFAFDPAPEKIPTLSAIFPAVVPTESLIAEPPPVLIMIDFC